MAADDDQWLQFQVKADVPAREQMDSLKLWLVANRPSTIARSAWVGWIAVKFKDKGEEGDVGHQAGHCPDVRGAGAQRVHGQGQPSGGH